MTQFRIPRPASARLVGNAFSGTPDVITLRFDYPDQSAYWIHWELERGVWSIWRAHSTGTSVVGLASGTGSFASALSCLVWEE